MHKNAIKTMHNKRIKMQVIGKNEQTFAFLVRLSQSEGFGDF